MNAKLSKLSNPPTYNSAGKRQFDNIVLATTEETVSIPDRKDAGELTSISIFVETGDDLDEIRAFATELASVVGMKVQPKVDPTTKLESDIRPTSNGGRVIILSRHINLNPKSVLEAWRKRKQ